MARLKQAAPDIADIARAVPGAGETQASEALAPPSWAFRLAVGERTHERIGLPGRRDAADVSVSVGPVGALVVVNLDIRGLRDERDLAAASEQVCGLALDRLARTPFPHPVRMWNFLPGICAPAGDTLDRYRVFNAARRRAFAGSFGEMAIESGRLPAATCVGPDGPMLSISALGAADPGQPLENPRQIPAFLYSQRHGPKPPCFSRAHLARFGEQRLLMVAGTASVLGEDSAHDGSLEQQLDETLNNLRSIVRQGRTAAGEREPDLTLGDILDVRVYAKRDQDLCWVRDNLPHELGSCPARHIEFLRADICREELLLEIEIVVDVTGV